MNIRLKPRIEALLKAQVDAGHFETIEDAITAAVLGAPVSEAALEDLTWAKPMLDEADRAIARGETLSEQEAYWDLERRLGKL